MSSEEQRIDAERQIFEAASQFIRANQGRPCQGKLMAEARKAWGTSVATLAHQRIALLEGGEALTPEMLDFSSCGEIPSTEGGS